MKKVLRMPQAATISLVLVLASMTFGSRSATAQTVGESAAVSALLSVSGEVPTPLHLSADDLAKLPRTEVHARGKDGKEAIYAGTSITEILLAAGLKFDPDAMPARGAVASYVVVEGADGYKAVYALAEFDPTQNGRLVLLADHKDGQPLASPEGPLRVVAPGEKRQARWVRRVIAISVRQS